MDQDSGFYSLSSKGLLFYTLVGLGLVVFQTTVMAWFIPGGFSPQLVIVLIFFLGIHAPILGGAVTVVCVGFIQDAAGGGMFGLSALIFLFIFFFTGIIRQKLDPTAPPYIVLSVFICVLGAGTITFMTLFLFDWPYEVTSMTCSASSFKLIVSSILTAVLGPLIYRILDFFRLQTGNRHERDA
jgi:rod shape-determining protein MreD